MLYVGHNNGQKLGINSFLVYKNLAKTDRLDLTHFPKARFLKIGKNRRDPNRAIIWNEESTV
jgi:hypothetical protein